MTGYPYPVTEQLLHRALNRTIANLGGYFWLPCVLCGQYSGGHEWKPRYDADGNRLKDCVEDPDYPGVANRGKGICPACVYAGRGTR